MGSEAKQTTRQHKKPCSDCPWARTALKGWLGQMTADEWLSLAHWDGTAECHTKIGPDGAHECAGLAIYRANTCKQPPTGAMKLPADREKVFSNPMEFYEHHTGEKLTGMIMPPVRPEDDPLEDEHED